ncbi:MAG: response regulator transcription factor [Nocardioidaceae bacterium]
MIRIVIADDQDLVRSGLRAILEAETDLDVVGEASDGKAAGEQAIDQAADVVLMDVEMPKCDGIESVHRLMAASPHIKVLMLTTFDLDEYVYEALRAGASGFLLKTASPGDLAAAVRAVHGGDMLFSPAVTRRLVASYVRRPPVGRSRPPALATLTERELDVFRSMARGLSNAEIATELYVGEATVRTHESRILAKLGLRDRVQAIVLAHESGLVRPDNRSTRADVRSDVDVLRPVGKRCRWARRLEDAEHRMATLRSGGPDAETASQRQALVVAAPLTHNLRHHLGRRGGPDAQCNRPDCHLSGTAR